MTPVSTAVPKRGVMEGAVRRLRPKMMTVSAIIFGLVPLMWSTETGAEVMRPLAPPVIGGMISSTILVLIVLPVLYLWMKEWESRRAGASSTTEACVAWGGLAGATGGGTA